MTRELDVTVATRTLHAYDTGGPGRAVVWHHGTPNVGRPPEPLFGPGVRWISYDRPGYGGSTPDHDRAVAGAARDVAAIADALGIESFAVVGHSGGGPHALACAALLPGRVLAAVSIAGLAPYTSDGWFDGMQAGGVAALRAALAGRAEKERFEAAGEAGEPEFTEADLETLRGEWSWINGVVGDAVAQGPGGLVADDLAFVRDWGFDPAAIACPTLLLHGGRDTVVPPAHSGWLAARIPGAELREFPDDGHLSVLRHAPDALAWATSSS